MPGPALLWTVIAKCAEALSACSTGVTRVIAKFSVQHLRAPGFSSLSRSELVAGTRVEARRDVLHGSVCVDREQEVDQVALAGGDVVGRALVQPHRAAGLGVRPPLRVVEQLGQRARAAGVQIRSTEGEAVERRRVEAEPALGARDEAELGRIELDLER